MRFLWIYIFCVLFGCGKRDQTEHRNWETPPELVARLNTYVAQSASMSWVSDKCDSVGFTALCKLYGGCAAANIYDAEVDGRWYRDPQKDCLGNGSKSDMSRDHLLMLMAYFETLAHSDQPQALAALRRMRSYLESHGWISGNHDGSIDGANRVLTLSLAPLLIDLIKHVEGLTPERAAETDEQKLDVIPVKTGYEAHIEVQKIRLAGIIYGGITVSEVNALRAHAGRVPDNALFLAVLAKYETGDFTAAWEALTRVNYCPVDHLPKSADRCSDYIYQREPGSDWAPCPKEGKTHSGNDCGMAMVVMSGG